uniref:tRNA(Ile)-lysidine synthase, chloroplastic n=1 Tax=Thaumatella adunca TaxID=2006976 RepID=A0A1Z1MNQ3_9FLOR|nr:tRNA Ile-lysidine synthetase [Thaumatella adunca]ARW67384.1 tRNA Ile-lysidine synthetase [Thaumatella adunca]
MNKYILYQFEYLINNFINKYSINSILLAISGGQDSICLIKLMNSLKKKLCRKNNFRISYIYIDHQWKKDSKKQIKHLINYIQSINEKIEIYQINKIIISENECRKYRYNIIFQHAIKYQYKLILTAHSNTDKIETFLQNIIRGCGIEGLTSLTIKSKFHNKQYILRPLNNIKRETVYWICKKFCLPIWSDSTNYIYKIQRNRIRQELLPYIKKYFHTNIENNIEKLLQNYYYDNEYIKQNTIKLYIKNTHNINIAINYKKIIKQNFALQSRTIQLFCFHNFQIYLDNNKIIKITEIIKNNALNSKIIMEHKNFSFHLNKNWIYLKLKI